MSGTDQQPSDVIRLAGALTTFGWFAFAGWVLFLFQVIYRVREVSESRAAGVWSQRIETLAFITFMPNLVVIAIPAAAAITATCLAGSGQPLELAILLRLVRWSSTAMAGVATLAVVSVMVDEGGSAPGTVAFRAGGALVCGALARLCFVIGRESPGG